MPKYCQLVYRGLSKMWFYLLQKTKRNVQWLDTSALRIKTTGRVSLRLFGI